MNLASSAYKLIYANVKEYIIPHRAFDFIGSFSNGINDGWKYLVISHKQAVFMRVG